MSFLSSLFPGTKKRPVTPDQQTMNPPSTIGLSDRIDEGGSAPMPMERIEATPPAPETMEPMSSRIAAPVSAPIEAAPVDKAGSWNMPLPYGRPRQMDTNTGRIAGASNVYNPPDDLPVVAAPRIAPGDLPPGGMAPGVGVPNQKPMGEAPPVSAIAEVKHPTGFWGKLGQTLGRIGKGALIGSQYGIGGAIYGAVKGGVDPYSIARWEDKNIRMPEYQARRAQAMKEEQEQAQLNNIEADNRRADEMMRINQQNQQIAVQDRQRRIAREEKGDAEEIAQKEYLRAQSTGTAVNPARVRGTSLESESGRIPPRRDAQKPEYRGVGGNLVRITPEGGVENIFSAPPKPPSAADIRAERNQERIEREHNEKDDKALATEFERLKKEVTMANAESQRIASEYDAQQRGAGTMKQTYTPDDVAAAEEKVNALRAQFGSLQEQIRSHPRLRLDKSGVGINYQGSRPIGGATSLGPASRYFD